jgi:hypothetical protein
MTPRVLVRRGEIQGIDGFLSLAVSSAGEGDLIHARRGRTRRLNRCRAVVLLVENAHELLAAGRLSAYGPAMRSWTFAGALLLLVCSCSADPGQRAVDREGAAIRACHRELTAKVGRTSTRSMPWRTTSRRSGSVITVHIWTRTPANAARPIGAPDFTCVKRG